MYCRMTASSKPTVLTQMHMVRHGMPLDQFDTHLVAEFPQDLANILAERAKDCFLPIFRYDDDVVSAIPPDMALVVPFAHCGFSFLWPWRVHTGRNHIPLHESTPERQSLFESHRQRRWLTHWSESVWGVHPGSQSAFVLGGGVMASRLPPK